MKKILFIVFVIIYSNCDGNNSIRWIHGVACINGVPMYIDSSKMYIPELFLSRKSIIQSSNPVIKHGKIALIDDPDKQYWYTYNINKNEGLYSFDVKSKTIFFYRVSNNTMLISKDGLVWSRIEISIVDEKPKEKNVILRINLQCPYFSGEYEMLSH